MHIPTKQHTHTHTHTNHHLYAPVRWILTFHWEFFLPLCSNEMHYDFMFQWDAFWPYVPGRCIMTCSSEMHPDLMFQWDALTICSMAMHCDLMFHWDALWLYVPVRHIVILWSGEDEEDFSKISNRIKQTTALANQLLCRLLRADINRTIRFLTNYNRSTQVFS